MSCSIGATTFCVINSHLNAHMENVSFILLFILLSIYSLLFFIIIFLPFVNLLFLFLMSGSTTKSRFSDNL